MSNWTSRKAWMMHARVRINTLSKDGVFFIVKKLTTPNYQYTIYSHSNLKPNIFKHENLHIFLRPAGQHQAIRHRNKKRCFARSQ